MHLLLAQKGSISDADEAIDLGQTTGDIIFLTAADTEIASIAAARVKTGDMDWRLASLSQLNHPMSVDTYVERMAGSVKLVVIRALGGAGYFSYALETMFAAASNIGFKIVVVPGDDKPDPELDRFNNVPLEIRDALWGYLIEGGGQNSAHFIRYCEAIITPQDLPPKAAPLLKAGLYWPDSPDQHIANLRQGIWLDNAPVVAIVFYRALVQSGQTAPVDALVQSFLEIGVNPLPIFVSSLKDQVSQGTVELLFGQCTPDVVINATGFAVSAPGATRKPTVLEAGGAVVLQAVFAGSDKQTWLSSSQGLSARDLAMHIALPEVDGRVMTRAVSFKSAEQYDENTQTNIVSHLPEPSRIRFVSELAKKWAELRRSSISERRIALVMANYPNKDGRLANGVGLDTPQSMVEVLKAMGSEGYDVAQVPSDSAALMEWIQAGPTNAANDGRETREVLSLGDYLKFFRGLPKQVQEQIQERWGDPEADPFFQDGQFALPLSKLGKMLIGIQPARGYNIDPTESYHSPDLVPPHGYLAFYIYLREIFGCHAIVHMGKHGNLEWLPGKALALSETCFPEAVLGPMPHLYPFIVNDPGEGTQAKRRTSAVIIDHLTPPLTRAENYGPLKDLEALVDEFYLASGSDPRRLKLLKSQILELVQDTNLQHDVGIKEGDGDELALEKLDAWLCELKEMQIRDGLHIFGLAPEGRLLTDLTIALARLPRGEGDEKASIIRALSQDLGFSNAFDPLDCDMAEVWSQDKPQLLQDLTPDPWRSCGDSVERLELLAAGLVSKDIDCPSDWTRTIAVLADIDDHILPNLIGSGPAELTGLLTGLNGEFVPSGPSGAPTRGRPDVLPTGRNFYSVDSRAVPTPAAWILGQKSAELLIARYVQDHGEWPQSFGITAWGTSNMRTGGDDIAQVLALIGVKPIWDNASRRVTGYEIIPMASLGRPRVDVTLRISGFFRDAFPDQISLIDRAVRAVGALDEDGADNPIAVRMKEDAKRLMAEGSDETSAMQQAGFRVFGSKPGAYGAGLQALIDEKGWTERSDLADAYLVWGSYAYGAGEEGRAERGLFETRLNTIQAVVQNQDNREHDLLDSDDYYQFEGGMTAAVEELSGVQPSVYHNDHSRPEKPIIRSLEEEVSRIVRGRVVNPKWIAGAMRHGYKGAFEMAATLDYMFAFSATTGAVRDHHFELVYDAYMRDDEVREFIEDANPEALREMAQRFLEAIDRELWTPRSNSAKFDLANILGDKDEPR